MNEIHLVGIALFLVSICGKQISDWCDWILRRYESIFELILGMNEYLIGMNQILVNS